MDTTKLVVGKKVWSDHEMWWVKNMGQQFDGTDPITDTRKLVVGQDVWVSRSCRLAPALRRAKPARIHNHASYGDGLAVRVRHVHRPVHPG
jgi:hypothetical protein